MDNSGRLSKCDVCAIRVNCDWLAEMCRLTPSEVVRLRPELIRTPTRRQLEWQRKKERDRAFAKRMEPIDTLINDYIHNGGDLDRVKVLAQQQATAALGFRKYDRRRAAART